jgi:DNA repair exonuclease SbcCD nuclease subunit
VRFLHCADLHLDSPLRGLERYEGAPYHEMREATRRAFEKLVDLALERSVDFVLIAGDVFDGDWQDFNTGLFFANQLRRLGDAEIRAYIVRGNHDALSKISKTVSLPANTHVFGADRPQTQVNEALGLAVHGQSFAREDVSADLAASYPPALPGLLNIGLLHTALAGRPEHAPYAPTTPERLADKGYHYWALGHVHTREIVRQAPWIVFPGNTQGRHARELGPKGCMIVEGDAEDGILSAEFAPIDVARWERLEIDISNLGSLDALSESLQRAVRGATLAADERILALRLSLCGRSALHGRLVQNPEQMRAELRAWVNEASGGSAWLEKVEIAVAAPLDLQSLALRDDPFGLLLRRLDEISGDEALLAQFAESQLAELAQKLPPELKERGSALNPLAPAFCAQALATARERLLAAISLEAAP